MRLLVTAGNTQAPIDRVRCITNIFSGRTGAAIAVRAWERGDVVTLLTSHPEVVAELRPAGSPTARWESHHYRTFDDLRAVMGTHLANGQFDAVVHCAAVSDYLAAGVFGAVEATAFDPVTGRWTVQTTPALTAGKLKSATAELWLRLVRAPKLVDMIRRDWRFRGMLVKFKLEVDVSDEQLLDVAERSRRQSDADLMVANTLEGAAEWAFLGPVADGYQRVARPELADRLLEAIAQLREGR